MSVQRIHQTTGPVLISEAIRGHPAPFDQPILDAETMTPIDATGADATRPAISIFSSVSCANERREVLSSRADLPISGYKATRNVRLIV